MECFLPNSDAVLFGYLNLDVEGLLIIDLIIDVLSIRLSRLIAI